ncbi:MAG: hypothetical protein ACRCU0_00890 [Candidatus Rhabdochlamydia sp.]
MTPISDPSNLMNIDSSNLLANHIITNKEESKKTSDTVLSLLHKILQNQANLFIKVEELSTKLEQQANKPVIPPPPPLPNMSLTISEKTKNFVNEPKNIDKKQEELQVNKPVIPLPPPLLNTSINAPKNIDNKQTMQEELQEELQKKLNKIRDKSEQNEHAVNSNPKENGISVSEKPELNFKLRRTQSLYIKPKNNTKAPENMDEKKIVSVADRIKQLQENL